ncbi:LamG domain-containing protein, partial [Actinophytocola sp.]|uniref:LamG domain-containing protein n=1 Tax=Actinophytocola sp. TaxID=1872138 RepID=UPI002D80D723
PVEDLSQRTERAQTFVNPDGTWTTNQVSSPVRVRRADGSWTAVDTTLHRVGERIRAAAVPYDVWFSGGGAGPMTRLAAGGGSVTLLPPWPLPAPVLDGAQARYLDVLPGVDLVLTARPGHISEMLVVKNRSAAGNPAVRQVRFGVQADGLSIRPDDEGGFVVADARGTPVLASPAPLMWDSAGGSAREIDAPANGDRSAPITLKFGPADLTLEPDLGLLTDPGTTFPVHLDPVVAGPRNDWAMISSGFPAEEYYNFSGDQGVGLCDVQDDGNCVRDQIKRLAWEFGIPAAVRGSHVLGATFSAYETAAYNCTARPVQLWRVNTVSSSTNWNNHSGSWAQLLHSVSVARSGGCSPGPGRVEFTATAGVATAAANRWASLGLGLRAGNEGNMSLGWKRFRNDATLSITYNTRPGTPTRLSSELAGCATGTARPVISTATPRLRAVVSDVDAGETDLRGSFVWQRLDTSVTPAVWRALGSGEQRSLRSGATAEVLIASGLVHGGIYRWQAQTLDPWSHNGSSGIDGSTASAWCEFEVDLQGPAVAPVVGSPVYGSDINQVYGAVGLTADFTFTASGVADVTGYRWGWADPPTTLVPAPSLGAAVTLPLTPPPPKPADPGSGGLMALYVVSVDRSGRTSPATVYPFNIGSATAPVASWNLAEPAGVTTLADSSGGRDAVLSGGATGTPGRMLGGPTALTLDGVDDSATATGVPIDTTRSFSVSAWLAPAATSSGIRDALSFSGVTSSSFMLRSNVDGRWVAYAVAGDVADPPRKNIIGTTATSRGVWNHVAAVHDAATRQLRLYVNGVLEATMTDATFFRATQAVQIGRTRYAGGYIMWWQGGIAEAKVWDRVVSAEELAPMAATLTGRWALDGDGSDASPFRRPVTGPDTIMWTDDQNGLPLSAVSLNGTTESLSTGGPVLRTDQSFTVAARVRTSSLVGNRTVLSQRGAEMSAFFLGTRHFLVNGVDQSRWSFSLPPRDGDGETLWHASLASAPITPDDLAVWTHLTGVFDASAGQIRLYVNGELAGTTARPDRWQATGPLEIGRALYSPGGGPPREVDYWPGDVDEVVVYQGVLPAPEIGKLAAL